jgi:hypothetical protein
MEGQRAFERGDFLHAAQAFEAAYRASPNADVLWNAARAYDRAGEAARSANLYARYLREAPPSAPDRDSATQSLKILAAKLGRVDVVAPGMADITIDGEPLQGSRIYVTPGAHVVSGGPSDAKIVKTATVAAGEAVSVALVSEHREKEIPNVVVLPPAPPSPPILSTWEIVTVVTGAASTAVLGGVLIWSGVDTLQARSAFNSGATPQALEDGRAKETRTNALIGGTAGLGALTIGATIGFVVARRRAQPPRTSLSIGTSTAGAAGVSLRGSF